MEISSILVDVPELDSAPQCFDLGLELAERHHAELTLMTVLPSFSDLFSIFETDQMREELQNDLESQAKAGLHCLSEIAKSKEVNFQEVIGKGS
ncbi:MAG: hypothetical protein KDD62_12400, partial [Bdellovibrionales bacterium]|nr:hypothetical protein [Bdellovibrionales bacterium]